MTFERTDFDTFGPWIDVVRSDDDMPRLYRPHPVDFAQVRLVLKIPRNIDRRDASPTMDLYDHVLVVDDTAVTCLSRSQTGFTASTIKHREIAVLDDSVELLDGTFELHGTNGVSVRVPYNGSSRDRVRELSNAILELARGGSPRSTITTRRERIRPDDLTPSDKGLISDFLTSTGPDSAARLVAAHAGRRVLGRSRGVTRVVDRLIPTRLHGTIMAATATELIVHSRREGITRTTKPNHSERRRTLVLSRLTDVRIAPHPRFEDVTETHLAFGERQLVLLTPTASETTATLAELRTGV